jgi:hypothetical protein
MISLEQPWKGIALQLHHVPTLEWVYSTQHGQEHSLVFPDSLMSLAPCYRREVQRSGMIVLLLENSQNLQHCQLLEILVPGFEVNSSSTPIPAPNVNT